MPLARESGLSYTRLNRRASMDSATTATIGDHRATDLPGRVRTVPFARLCSACHGVITGEFYQVLKPGYFQSKERPVCAACTGRMKTESEHTRAISAGRILAWGGAAALAACVVSIVLIG